MRAHQQSEIDRLDALVRRPNITVVGIDWGRAVFTGAITGGVLWGYLFTMGLRGAPAVLLFAGAYCAVLLLLGALLMSLTKNQTVQTIGAAVAIAGGLGPAAVAVPWGLPAIVVGLLVAYLVVRIRQHRAKPAQPATRTLPDIDPSSQRPATVRDSPAALLSGLLFGVALGYLVWIFLAFFNVIVLTVLGMTLLAARQTAAFGAGILAAAAGIAALTICFYTIVLIVG